MNKTELLNLSKERLAGIIYMYIIEKDNLIKYLENKIENERKIQKFLYENKNTKFAIEKVEEKYYITDRYDFEKSNILGEYKTEKRALEVLDEIQECMTIDHTHYEDKYNSCYQECSFYKSDILLMYEMPKE